MGKMKGAGAGASRFIQWLFLIIICLFLIYVLIVWVSASEASLKNVEEATVVYTITSSINGFSVAEKASMQIDFSSEYDIEIDCDDGCYIKVTPYDEGKRGKSSEKFLIVGNIKQSSLKLVKVGKVCVEKGYEDPKDKVVIKKC